MRLIDADAILKKAWDADTRIGYVQVVDVGDIKDAPTIESEQQWIPVSERLPRKYAQYLVCFESGECYVYWLEDSDWARGMAEKEGIIAWMPLPAPYKGGDDK